MELEEQLDHQRWLINNGLFSDQIKNNIYVYGALVNKYVMSVDAAIDIDKKGILYTLYCKKGLINAIEKYKILKDNKDLWSIIKLRFIVKKFGNLNLQKILSSFIRDYCGPSWNVTIVLRDESEYVDEKQPEGQS